MTRKIRDTNPEDFNNAHGILACLENDGPQSRAAVAKKLDLSRTTLTNLIARLMDLGLVSESEETDRSGRGRPGIPVDLDNTNWFSLGTVFYSGRWVFAITNLRGDVLLTQTTTVGSDNSKSVVSALIKGVKAIQSKAPGKLLPGVGVGAPGLVNWETGTVLRADDLGWTSVALGDAVEEATGMAAYVVNRNRAVGIAEARYGSGRNVSNFVYIGIGTGISAALMLNGTLIHGATSSAGEIGHIIVDPKGPACGCGNRGCLQTLASDKALADKARSLYAAGKIGKTSSLFAALGDGGGVSGMDVCAAAAAGDRAALACIRDAAQYLGREVGNLITTFNPEKVVLGGPLVRAGSVLVDQVREEAGLWAMKHPLSSVVIEASSLDEYAGARGAACLVLQNKLELCSP